MSQVITFEEFQKQFFDRIESEADQYYCIDDAISNLLDECLYDDEGYPLLSTADERKARRKSIRTYIKEYRVDHLLPEELQEANYKIAFASLLPLERAIVEELGENVWGSVAVRDGKFYATYYPNGSKSVGIFTDPDNRGSELILREAFFTRFNLTVEQGIELFNKLGFEKVKRPKRPKFQYGSLYD